MVALRKKMLSIEEKTEDSHPVREHRPSTPERPFQKEALRRVRRRSACDSVEGYLLKASAKPRAR